LPINGRREAVSLDSKTRSAILRQAAAHSLLRRRVGCAHHLLRAHVRELVGTAHPTARMPQKRETEQSKSAIPLRHPARDGTTKSPRPDRSDRGLYDKRWDDPSVGKHLVLRRLRPRRIGERIASLGAGHTIAVWRGRSSVVVFGFRLAWLSPQSRVSGVQLLYL